VKLAYVITAHKNAGQLRRLLAAIDSAHHTYVLHVDRRAPAPVHAAAYDFASRHPRAAVMAPRNIGWGAWSLCRIQIDLMASALNVSDDWQYLINLSGQDFPLRTQEEIAAALAAGPAGANRLQVLDFAATNGTIRKRLDHYWIEWHSRSRRLWRRQLPADARIYWGSNWVIHSRQACAYVTGPEARHWQRFFRFSMIPDEFFFQTALMNSPLAGTIIADNARHIIWNGGPNPRILTDADRNSLLASPAWFARKFDETTHPAILDEMERALARRRATTATAA
jgi:hypothetical protein